MEIMGQTPEQLARVICQEFEVESEAKDFVINTPFIYDDGDNLSVLCHRKGEGWILSDSGETFLHLGYFFVDGDYRTSTRGDLIMNYEKMFRVEEFDGELIARVEDGDKFGDRVFELLQCMLKISDITFLKQERVASTFVKDVQAALVGVLKEWNIEPTRKYCVAHDDKRLYPVDYRFNLGGQEIFVFTIRSERKCLYATIAAYNFEKWQVDCKIVGIFENQESIESRAVSMFSDVAEKQVPSISGIDHLRNYLSTFAKLAPKST